MKKLAIVTVPYINNSRTEILAQKSYESIWESVSVNSNPDLFDTKGIAVVNKTTKEAQPVIDRFNDVVIDNTRNNCLGAAWNIGVSKAIELGYEYILIPNLDVEARLETIPNLIKFAESTPEAGLWSATACNNTLDFVSRKLELRHTPIMHNEQSFSFFLIHAGTWLKVKFREIFKPCYFEDDAYLIDCKEVGFSPQRTLNAVFYHYIQGTVRNDPSAQDEFSRTFAKNKRLFLELYGGLPANGVMSSIR